MARIDIGQNLKTNYATGPYKVLSVMRNCVCTHILDEIENIEHPLPPHAHLWLRYTDDAPTHNRGKQAWINYLDEETLRTYGAGGKFTRDRIILCENPEPVQVSLPV